MTTMARIRDSLRTILLQLTEGLVALPLPRLTGDPVPARTKRLPGVEYRCTV